MGANNRKIYLYVIKIYIDAIYVEDKSDIKIIYII